MSSSERVGDAEYEAAVRAVRKALKMLIDALDRTPLTITSRTLIEASVDLLAGALTSLEKRKI